MDDVTDSTARPGELTLQIRNFHSYGDMHRGGVWMRMVLYARATGGDERYSVLDVLDTVVETTTNVFKGSLHNRVVSATDETLTRFIRANLRRGLANAARWYGPGDLHDVENLTKSDLFVFTADTLKNGVYLSYSSFASQQ